MDTLGSGYGLPATGRPRDFHPLECAHAGRTKKALSSCDSAFLFLFSQTIPEIIISEVAQFFYNARFMADVEVRQRHSIECIGFTGRINSHITKEKQITCFERPVKTILPNDIARQVGPPRRYV